ncbi:hypothetical protein BSKO_01987 [Bryopsis sp. KO-2023]|nr:hypothetical protein BSKO_01987 [Bryopsis sp. KO-2023]
MAERSLATLGAGKQLYQKVAVVTNALSPLGEAFCVQFAREGASLLLVDGDYEGAIAMAEDINMLGGLDPNYGDIGHDPWGSSIKAVAVQVDRLTPDLADKLVTTSVNSFGRSPDILADMSGLLGSEFTTALSHSCGIVSKMMYQEGGKQMAKSFKNDADKSSVVTVTPFTSREIFMPGWLGVLDPLSDDLDSIEFDGECPRLHILCSESNARILNGGQAMRRSLRARDCNIEVRCSNLVSLLPRLTSGLMQGAEFKLVDWEDSAEDRALGNGDLSELVMSVNVERLCCTDEESQSDDISDYESNVQAVSSPRSPLPETIVSRAILGRPFDACLQKNDGYPEDVWGIVGGREIEKPEALRVLDDDCVLSIARSAVNCSVRWLLFGYIVIMVAVPRVLGGLSVGI